MAAPRTKCGRQLDQAQWAQTDKKRDSVWATIVGQREVECTETGGARFPSNTRRKWSLKHQGEKFWEECEAFLKRMLIWQAP
eukprot:5188398-Amphidinium_carterae.1